MVIKLKYFSSYRLYPFEDIYTVIIKLETLHV